MVDRGPDLVVCYEGPVGTVHRNMLHALRNDFYEAVTGDPDEDEHGFLLVARPSGGEDPHPVPNISFRMMTAPMTHPHDPVAIALSLLQARRIDRDETKRIRSAMTAAASTNGFDPVRSENPLILTLCASPWSRFALSDWSGRIDPFSKDPDKRSVIAHDGVIERMLPQIVDTSYPGSNLDPAHTRTLSFMPMATYVDQTMIMDPMQAMRTIAEIGRNPVRTMAA